MVASSESLSAWILVVKPCGPAAVEPIVRQAEPVIPIGVEALVGVFCLVSDE